MAGRQVATTDPVGNARFLSAGAVTHWVAGACATLPPLPLLGLPPCPLLVGRVMTLPRRAASLPLVPVQRSFDSSIERQFMFALRAASGLVAMKFWCCDARGRLGLPMIVPSVPTGRHFSAVNQSSVALRRTLHSQDGIHGKPITLPIPMAPALRSIGRALFGLKPGCHDAMMHHA